MGRKDEEGPPQKITKRTKVDQPFVAFVIFVAD
jgi:hypothetical protein